MIRRYIEDQIEWSKKVFGDPADAPKDYGFDGKATCAHIRSELIEIEKNPTDIYEWIDVIILALDGAWRSGASPFKIISVLLDKQRINFARKWGKRNAQGFIEHVKEA